MCESLSFFLSTVVRHIISSSFYPSFQLVGPPPPPGCKTRDVGRHVMTCAPFILAPEAKALAETGLSFSCWPGNVDVTGFVGLLLPLSFFSSADVAAVLLFSASLISFATEFSESLGLLSSGQRERFVRWVIDG